VTETMTLVRALNEGLRRAMSEDPRLLLLGEDIGTLGGVFRVTDGLQKDFGPDRVVDAPLSESGIVGTAIGLAVAGYRTVCEIQFDGFVFPAFNQIVSHAAKFHKRTDGHYTMGLVIRLPFQGGIGAIEHHSESPEAYFAHTPGLRVVACSNPNDAYWMIQQAARSADPIIFCEPKACYWDKGEVSTDAPRYGLYDAAVLREGSDVTVVGHGSYIKALVTAAEVAQSEGRSLELIDLRSLAPLDFDTIETSVKKTGRLVVVQEAPHSASVGAEIVSEMARRCFYEMRAPGVVVSGYHVPFPISRYENVYRPSVERILDGVDRVLEYA
jgi:2-oxoisovalerate dehydrogenase E1 component beta subunit